MSEVKDAVSYLRFLTMMAKSSRRDKAVRQAMGYIRSLIKNVTRTDKFNPYHDDEGKFTNEQNARFRVNADGSIERVEFDPNTKKLKVIGSGPEFVPDSVRESITGERSAREKKVYGPAHTPFGHWSKPFEYEGKQARVLRLAEDNETYAWAVPNPKGGVWAGVADLAGGLDNTDKKANVFVGSFRTEQEGLEAATAKLRERVSDKVKAGTAIASRHHIAPPEGFVAPESDKPTPMFAVPEAPPAKPKAGRAAASTGSVDPVTGLDPEGKFVPRPKGWKGKADRPDRPDRPVPKFDAPMGAAGPVWSKPPQKLVETADGKKELVDDEKATITARMGKNPQYSVSVKPVGDLWEARAFDHFDPEGKAGAKEVWAMQYPSKDEAMKGAGARLRQLVEVESEGPRQYRKLEPSSPGQKKIEDGVEVQWTPKGDAGMSARAFQLGAYALTADIDGHPGRGYNAVVRDAGSPVWSGQFSDRFEAAKMLGAIMKRQASTHILRGIPATQSAGAVDFEGKKDAPVEQPTLKPSEVDVEARRAAGSPERTAKLFQDKLFDRLKKFVPGDPASAVKPTDTGVEFHRPMVLSMPGDDKKWKDEVGRMLAEHGLDRHFEITGTRVDRKGGVGRRATFVVTVEPKEQPEEPEMQPDTGEKKKPDFPGSFEAPKPLARRPYQELTECIEFLNELVKSFKAR